MEQIYNPYLPLQEYIPDGEPHVYDGRLYIYGSHDRAGGTVFCEQHYQVWSAPLTNLKDWHNEGVSYLRSQDPSNADDTMQLWAPDVTRGPDGRYYLYYCLNFYPEIGVAVSDKPAGPFAFYGHVHYPTEMHGGETLHMVPLFDPAVLTDDDGKVYLYYGFAPACERAWSLPDFTEEELAAMPDKDREMITKIQSTTFGEDSYVVELEPDMLTVKEEPRVLIPGGNHTEGTGFEGHGFFEASSIRKVNGRYYFIYSSHKSHELCYAVSDYPDREFYYGGTLVSNGDIGLNGRETPVYPLSNNHGSIVQVGEDWYVFYQRCTDGTEFSRQGCAEKITIAPDGTIEQVEVTSCGLNGGPLLASGSYPAAICCHLTDPTVRNWIDFGDPVMRQQVCVTEQQNQSYITRIKDQTTVGYKYFDFPVSGQRTMSLLLELCGDFQGTVTVSHDEEGKQAIGTLSYGNGPEVPYDKAKIDLSDFEKQKAADIAAGKDDWHIYRVPVCPASGTQALYFHFAGTGIMEMKSFAFMEEE